MKINGEEIDINELVSKTLVEIPEIKYRKNNIFLNARQIDILTRYGIDYKKYRDIKEIIFDIETLISEDDIEELDKVSQELSEFNYYHNTYK